MSYPSLMPSWTSAPRSRSVITGGRRRTSMMRSRLPNINHPQVSTNQHYMKKSKNSAEKAVLRGARKSLLPSFRRNTSRKTDTLGLGLTTTRGGLRSLECIPIPIQNPHFSWMWSTMLRQAHQVFNITLIFHKSLQGHIQLL